MDGSDGCNACDNVDVDVMDVVMDVAGLITCTVLVAGGALMDRLGLDVDVDVDVGDVVAERFCCIANVKARPDGMADDNTTTSPSVLRREKDTSEGS